MTPTEFQGLTVAIFSGVGLLSAGIWVMFLLGWYETGTLLPYATRSPVRWGPLGFAVAVFFVSTTVAAAISSDTELPPPDEFVSQIWAYSLVTLVLIGMSQVWIWKKRGMPATDLGWPTNPREWTDDLKLGITVAFAAAGPVYAVQIGLVSGLGLESKHQLIDAFEREPRIDVALAACFSAVIAAPIFEELLFRQLAQGWLERAEDDFLGWRESAVEFVDGESSTAEPSVDHHSPAEMATDAPLETFLVEPDSTGLSPPTRSVGGLPYGWLPIGVGSLLFSLAHAGQGASPVSLFFLALGLGFVYQRTHRIVPCIIAHMLFNAFGMLLVGLSMLVEKP